MIARMKRTVLLSVGLLSLGPGLVFVTAKLAGATPEKEMTPRDSTPRELQGSAQKLLEEMDRTTREAVRPLPAGEVKVLEAVVMGVQGRAQWRPTDEATTWNGAKVDDILRPGARIRTGRKSFLALRVGLNASILVDRNSRMVLPQMIQTGGTLTTAIQLSRGRADFKIDRVGLTNDFSVVTPSASLAVRGTGYAVRYGGFNGTEVFVASRDLLSRIELTYFLTRFTYALTEGSDSSDAFPDPAINALFQTFGPPRFLQDVPADELLLRLVDRGAPPPPVILDPIVDLRRVDLGIQSQDSVLDDLDTRGSQSLRTSGAEGPGARKSRYSDPRPMRIEEPPRRRRQP